MLEVVGLSCPSPDGFIENVNFHIAKGDFFVLFGPDNSGKTELINTILGISKQYAGTVTYQERNRKKLSIKERKQIRYVPDEILMLYGVKAKKYLSKIAKQYHMKDKEKIKSLIEYFDIDVNEYLTEMTYEGNKLVSIIAALLTSPELLILDEPFNFLLDESSDKLLAYLKEKNNEGMTILLVAEHFEDAKEYANSYFYINEGEPIEEGRIAPDWIPPKKIVFHNPNYEKMEQLFGPPDETYRTDYTYICDLPWEEIGKRITECGMEKRVTVKQARMDEILDVKYKKQPESTEETVEEAEVIPKKKKKLLNRMKKEKVTDELAPVMKEEDTIEQLASATKEENATEQLVNVTKDAETVNELTSTAKEDKIIEVKEKTE